MAKFKRYINRNIDGTYNARLATSIDSEPKVSKTGFKSHAKAQNWLNTQYDKLVPDYSDMSPYELYIEMQKNGDKNILSILGNIIKELKDSLIYHAILNGAEEQDAIENANRLCGRTFKESLTKVKDKTIDALMEIAIENEIETAEEYLEYLEDSMWEPSPAALVIEKLINQIPGEKMVTITDGEGHYVFEIDQNGNFEYPQYQNILWSKLDLGLEGYSVVIIRQVIPNSAEKVKLPNGQAANIPWNALYGFVLNDSELIPLDADEVESGFLEGYEEVEERVIYKDITDFIDFNEQKLI